MKKLLIFIPLSIFMLLAIYTPTMADPLDDSCSTSGVSSSSSFCSNVGTEKIRGDRILGPDGVITKLTQTAVYVSGAVSVIVVFVGGFKYAISGGDSNGVASAKNTIMYALVGLVVAIFSQAIVSFVLVRL